MEKQPSESLIELLDLTNPAAHTRFCSDPQLAEPANRVKPENR